MKEDGDRRGMVLWVFFIYILRKRDVCSSFFPLELMDYEGSGTIQSPSGLLFQKLPTHF